MYSTSVDVSFQHRGEGGGVNTDDLAALDAWRGERMYWDLASEDDRHLHLSRYEFARNRFQSDWTCLDAACGSGYGTSFLAEKVRQAEGVDVDPHAIAFATKTYSKQNVAYRCADLQFKLPFEDHTFNAIASFETFEHVADQRTMLSEFHRVLKPGGIIVISTPDRNVSQSIGLDNRFHVAERSKREFVNLLTDVFVLEELFGHGRGEPIARHWRTIHQCLRLGTCLTSSKLRSRIEAKLAQQFGWLRSHFYKMSVGGIQPDPCVDRTTFMYVIAVARKCK